MENIGTEGGSEVINMPMRSGPTANPTSNAGAQEPQPEALTRAEIERRSERSMKPLRAAMQKSADINKPDLLFFADLGPSKNLIFEAYIEGVPEKDRDIFKCKACLEFLQDYGSLCIIRSDGTLRPLLWSHDNVVFPAYYKQSVFNISKLFEGKGVTNEFKVQRDKRRTLGKQLIGGWDHISIKLSICHLMRTRYYPMASQDTQTSYAMLNRVLEDNSIAVIEMAYHFLHSGMLSSRDAHTAPIAYLQNVAQKISRKNMNAISRRNLITRCAREASVTCLSSLHEGIVGLLLHEMRGSTNFDDLHSFWMHAAYPHNYLGPVSNIEQAEKIVANLGYKPYDLERVYLTLDQVPQSGILWSPKPMSSSAWEFSPGSSGSPHLDKLLNIAPQEQWGFPAKKISLRNFAERVLPAVSYMELFVKPQEKIWFMLKGKENSKPVMYFHSKTNTASWYTRRNEIDVSDANLKPGWITVKSIITFPHMWEKISPFDAFIHEEAEQFEYGGNAHRIRYLFCLDGAKEQKNLALGLIPDLMKNKFRKVRNMVETLNRSGRVDQPEKSKDHVGGVAFQKGGLEEEVLVRVKTHAGQLSRYRIVLFDSDHGYRNKGVD